MSANDDETRQVRNQQSRRDDPSIGSTAPQHEPSTRRNGNAPPPTEVLPGPDSGYPGPLGYSDQSEVVDPWDAAATPGVSNAPADDEPVPARDAPSTNWRTLGIAAACIALLAIVGLVMSLLTRPSSAPENRPAAIPTVTDTTTVTPPRAETQTTTVTRTATETATQTDRTTETSTVTTTITSPTTSTVTVTPTTTPTS